MTDPLPEERRRVGKYEIVEKIGEGGYSCVYRGFDSLIKRQVAIKSCPSGDREIRERFYREAEIAGNLDHPNIVRVYDLFIEEETPYLIQELLDGEDLDDRIERREPTSFAEKLHYLIQIARGLEYAHTHGVIHRDIKPANVRVLDDGSIKILDFGIAKLVHYSSDLTEKGMAVGTAAYLAPEQIRGEKASPATDIFAFGVLAYELLTHVRPFGRETISETFYQTLNYDPAPLTAHWVDCPRELVDIVSRCLHKDPAHRFSSCTELLLALDATHDDLPAEWSPEPNPAKTQLLPAGLDLALRTPTPVPGAAAAERTQKTPIDGVLRSPPSRQVDLPLRPRPSGIILAGTARRRRSRAWIPALALIAIGLASWPWFPFDRAASAVEGWFADASSAPNPEAPIAAQPTPSETEPAATATPPVARAEPEPASPTAAVEPPVEATPAPAASAESASLSFEGVWTPRLQLSIDGAPAMTLGRTRAISVEPGAHSLTFSLEAEGYRASRTLGVQLAAGESKRIPVPLDPPGRLTVQAHLGAPQGLVRVGSQRQLRPTPLRGQPIRPGKHRLQIFSYDDRSTPLFESVVAIRPGHEAIVTFDLEGSRQPHVREKRIQR